MPIRTGVCRRSTSMISKGMPMQPAITVRYSAQRRRRANPTASVSSRAPNRIAPMPISSTVRVENSPIGRNTADRILGISRRSGFTFSSATQPLTRPTMPRLLVSKATPSTATSVPRIPRSRMINRTTVSTGCVSRPSSRLTFCQKVKRELGRETQPVDTVVRLIILERGIRGTLVAVLGVALLTSSRGIVGLVRGWVAELNVNPERRLIPRILSAVLRPVGQFSTRTVVLIAIGAILFGALELTEAVGLARRRRWAEYLTVIAGCIGIPFEIMEVLRRQTPVRIGILLVNVTIVIYLAWQKHLFGLRGGVATETERS